MVGVALRLPFVSRRLPSQHGYERMLTVCPPYFPTGGREAADRAHVRERGATAADAADEALEAFLIFVSR
jgi:hypothetical protein